MFPEAHFANFVATLSQAIAREPGVLEVVLSILFKLAGRFALICTAGYVLVCLCIIAVDVVIPFLFLIAFVPIAVVVLVLQLVAASLRFCITAIYFITLRKLTRVGLLSHRSESRRRDPSWFKHRAGPLLQAVAQNPLGRTRPRLVLFIP